MIDQVSIISYKIFCTFPPQNLVCRISLSLFLWVVPHHLTISTEVETVCPVHFVRDFEIILFQRHTTYTQNLWFVTQKKISESANTEEKSNCLKFLYKFLVSNRCHFVICIPPLLPLSSSRIKILCSSVTFTKRELKDHVVTADERIFLFAYSVLLIECDVKVAVPFKEDKTTSHSLIFFRIQERTWFNKCAKQCT